MINKTQLCPICGDGFLNPQIGKNSVDYKGQSTELDLYFSLCDGCGSEQTDSDQLRVNKRAMLAFRKRVDGLLSGSEVRAVRAMLNLSQADAAKILGGGPVAFSKYESDDVVQSEAMDRLLRLVGNLPGALPYLQLRVGFVAEAPEAWTPAQMILAKEAPHRLKILSSSTPEPEPVWGECA